MMNVVKFCAEFKLSPVDKDEHETEFTMELEDGTDECSLTYDEVLFAAVDAMEKDYPSKYYPHADITLISIFEKDGNGDWTSKRFPVMNSDDAEMMAKAKEFAQRLGVDRTLELPSARYGLTPEYKLYLKMVEAGLINQDKKPFDFDTMHKLVESIDESNRKNRRLNKLKSRN